MLCATQRKLSIGIVILLLPIVTPGTGHTADCIDSDGDGWGWDGEKSCVAATTLPETDIIQSLTACVDPDGDGWGWNGTSSCLAGASSTLTGQITQPETNCVDPDGDGWGWNGTSSCQAVASSAQTSQSTQAETSCVDPDGDGWGWNGVDSCRVENALQQNDVTQTPGVVSSGIALSGIDSFAATSWGWTGVSSPSSDPHWRVCDAEEGLNSSNAWQTDTHRRPVSGNVCVKRCPSGSDFIPDPSFPGWGWDNLNSTACAVVDEDVFTLNYAPVPLYLPNTTPARQILTTPIVFHLYAGNGDWNCAVQQRQLSSQTFQDTGVYIDIQFRSEGTLRHKLNSITQWTEGTWAFDANAGHKVLSVGNRVLQTPSGPTFTSWPVDNYPQNSLNGNLRVQHNEMEIYNTTVDRLTCTSGRDASATAGYPVSIEQVEAAPTLGLIELQTNTLQCEIFQSLNIHPQSAALSLEGYRSRDFSVSESGRDISQSQTINIQPIVLDDSYVYRERYILDDSSSDFSLLNTGSFSGSNLLVGDVSRSASHHFVTFSNVNDRIIRTDRQHSGGGSGNSGTYTHTLSLCQAL